MEYGFFHFLFFSSNLVLSMMLPILYGWLGDFVNDIKKSWLRKLHMLTHAHKTTQLLSESIKGERTDELTGSRTS